MHHCCTADSPAQEQRKGGHEHERDYVAVATPPLPVLPPRSAKPIECGQRDVCPVNLGLGDALLTNHLPLARRTIVPPCHDMVEGPGLPQIITTNSRSIRAALRRSSAATAGLSPAVPSCIARAETADEDFQVRGSSSPSGGFSCRAGHGQPKKQEASGGWARPTASLGTMIALHCVPEPNTASSGGSPRGVCNMTGVGG